MTKSRAWVGMLWGMVLLGACVAPVPEDVVVPPTGTPRVPSLTVATFTPPATPPGPVEVGAPVQPDAPAPVDAPIEVKPLVRYTVEAGDTLLGIALHYGVPMAAIQLQNDLGTSTIVQVGQVLEIPPAVGWEGASPFWVVYAVQEGDVLSAIAADYGFDIAVLQSVNGLADADLLSVGQALILPLDAPADVAVAANRPAAAEAPLLTVTPIVPTATLAPLAQPVSTATPAPAQPAPTPVPAQPLPVDVAAMPAEIFRLLNEQRAAYGLGPLAWNATLARAAQLHADDCQARGWCGHTGSDGSTMKERIIRQGYDPVRWSECWAWYGSPEMAVAMWMDEVPPDDPHRRTILSTWLAEVGVGVVPGNGHGYYFIADFGTPR